MKAEEQKPNKYGHSGSETLVVTGCETCWQQEALRVLAATARVDPLTVEAASPLGGDMAQLGSVQLHPLGASRSKSYSPYPTLKLRKRLEENKTRATSTKTIYSNRRVLLNNTWLFAVRRRMLTAVTGILTARRLLSKPPHQLIMCELDKRIVLLCGKTHCDVQSWPLEDSWKVTNIFRKSHLRALSSASRRTPHGFCPPAPSVVFRRSSRPVWGKTTAALSWWERTTHLRRHLSGHGDNR